MSVQAMAWVLDHSPTQGSERLVLLALANHASLAVTGDAFEAYPGIATITREARFDRERTTQEVLARLVASGAITRELNAAPDERIRKDRRPNLCRILLAHGTATCENRSCTWCTNGVTPHDTPSAVHEIQDGMTPHGTPRHPRGAASRHNGVTPHDITGCRDTAPEPSLNQEKNQSLRGGAAAATRPDEPAAALIGGQTRLAVAAYAGEYKLRHGGASAPRAWRDAAGRASRTALAIDVVPIDVVMTCLAVIAREDKHPNTLPFVIADYQRDHALEATS